MEINNFYQDMNKRFFICIAVNDTEVFVAPVESLQFENESPELIIDYTSIQVFEKDNPGYFIRSKYTNVEHKFKGYTF